MNPIDVERILTGKRPVPPKPDTQTFLQACDHFGFQPPVEAIRKADAR